MQPNDISIDWQINQAFAAPRTWHYWDTPELVRAIASTDARLDRRLAWPLGCSGILEAAFASGLSRSTGWECSTEASSSDATALAYAAKIYKRGVAWRRQPHLQAATVTTSGSYHVHIHAPAAQIIQSLGNNDFLLIDGNVQRHWPSLPNTSRCLSMNLSEHDKTLSSVALILETWRHLGQHKSWTIIGGGLLADVAAFAASLVDCDIQLVPTTLLAMADACVGGKTGVNLAPYGKNQVGSFYFPKAVQVWPGWLSTLPERELRAGTAECIKHAFLCGDLNLARQIAKATAKLELEALATLLPHIIQVKANVVRQDPAETGQRAILNFGHTLAHALEAMAHDRTNSETSILHGEAVGIGLAYALLISHMRTNLEATELKTMLDTLRQAGILLTLDELRSRIGVANLKDPEVFDQLWDFALHDKKNQNALGSIEFVLLTGCGRVARGPSGQWTIPIDKDIARQAWHKLFALLA